MCGLRSIELSLLYCVEKLYSNCRCQYIAIRRHDSARHYHFNRGQPSRIEEEIFASVLSVRLLPLLVQAQISDLSFTAHTDLTPTLNSQLGDSKPAYRTAVEEI